MTITNFVEVIDLINFVEVIDLTNFLQVIDLTFKWFHTYQSQSEMLILSCVTPCSKFGGLIIVIS